MRNRGVGLGVKISFLVTMIIVLLIVAGTFLTYQSIKRTVEETMQRQSVDFAENSARFIDSNVYERFLANPTESQDYWKIRNQLNDIRTKTHAMFVYTIAVDQQKKLTYMIDGQPRDSKEASDIGEKVESNSYQDVEGALQGRAVSTQILPDEKYGASLSGFSPIKNAQGKVIGILGVDISANTVGDITSEIMREKMNLSILSSLALIVGAMVIFVVLIRINLRPLQILTQTAEEIGRGDFSRSSELIEGLSIKSKDEVGKLSNAFIQMVAMLENVRTVFKEVRLATDTVTVSSQDLSTIAHQSGVTSDQVAHNIGEVAEGVRQQAEQASRILAMMQEAYAKVQEGSNQAEHTFTNAKSSKELSKKGNEAIMDAIEHLHSVTQTVSLAAESIQRLGQRSNEIGSIITTITEIANQTNLLALNAAIEAARAGEQGKGFAVVADEVRKLAEQSGEAASQISGLIHTIQSETDTAVRIMENNLEEVNVQVHMITEGGKALTTVVEKVEETEGSAVQMQGIFSLLERNAEQVLAAIESISQVASKSARASEQVAAAAEEQSAMVEEIAGTSTELASLSMRLKEDVQNFTI